ncbi:fimbrial protein [Achromobacter veterisilvae]|uniref:Fimbrial protein n=1 Tax=Achromobacter veterisilvae TaxID=2069367 RepID=A0ABZ2SAC3_9BURK
MTRRESVHGNGTRSTKLIHGKKGFGLRKRGRGARLNTILGGVALTAGLLPATPAHAAYASCTITSTAGMFSSVSFWNLPASPTFTKGAVLATHDMRLNITINQLRSVGKQAPNPGGTGLRSDRIFITEPSWGNVPWDTATRSSLLNYYPKLGGRFIVTGITTSNLDPDVDTGVQFPVMLEPNKYTGGFRFFVAHKDNDDKVKRITATLTITGRYEIVLQNPDGYVSSYLTQDALRLNQGPLINVFLGSFPDNTTNDGESGIDCFTPTYMANNNLGNLESVQLPSNYPTCQFDTNSLNQTVNLLGVNASRVVAAGRPREEGTENEATFSLIANNCAAGATFSMYFSDPQGTGAQVNYLKPERGNVGIRLYRDADVSSGTPASQNPIVYLPQPVGSSLPSPTATNPIKYGNASAPKNASYNMKFTAQYVRLPDTPPVAEAGSVKAKATVTIVYP